VAIEKGVYASPCSARPSAPLRPGTPGSLRGPARALSRLRQDKRDLLCAIGMGFGMGLAGVGTTLRWSAEVGLGVNMTACGLHAGTLLLAW
jgi:hypothetical protein